MAARKKVVLDSITIDPAGPTSVPMDRLFAWVIWQFPRVRHGGYSGAIHPPEAGHGWYPAVVNAEEGHVIIHGHVKEPFTSPEAASKHLDRAAS
ncbi:MAG: hypothetical protein KBF17_04195 [Candidatus Promineofilum sp.]|nr:hypothetical protein [Promineifilum sp.]MBP9656346.1 hypothetical protein [Promineifilum sp.]